MHATSSALLTAQAKLLRCAADSLDEAANTLAAFESLSRDASNSTTSKPLASSISKGPDVQDLANFRGGSWEVMSACYHILKEHGQPMHKEELFKRLKARGAKLTKLSTLTSYLSRDLKFANYGRSIWGLGEWSTKGANGKRQLNTK